METAFFRFVLNSFKEPISGVCVIAIIATIVALVISTRYSLRNLLNLRSYRPSESDKTAEQDQSKEKHTSDGILKSNPSDAAGNDGDDESDGEEEEELNPSYSAVQSPRYPDPVDYCEHIQGEIKRVQQSVASKSIAEKLTAEQLQEEQELQRRQLADIFKLMQEQQDKFGMGSMDDMQEQMRLYAV